jgi:hypothetical protein
MRESHGIADCVRLALLLLLRTLLMHKKSADDIKNLLVTLKICW